MRTLLLSLAVLSSLAFAEQITIDWERAKALHQRVSSGETLSAEDQKYYDEAKRQHEARGSTDADQNNPDMARAKDIHRRKEAGQTVTPEEEKFLAEMVRKHTGGGKAPEGQSSAAVIEPPKGLVPLTELKGDYHGQDGGLYGGGKNEPPVELDARAKNAAAQVHPLDADGQPAADGKIVFVSLGMSNTTQEFSTFKRLADADPRKAADVVVVDCAQGGRTAQAWAQNDQPWEEALHRIKVAGVTPAQVQVMWLKQANAGPSEGWPAATEKLRDDIRTDLQRAREKYPNLRLVFLSSRIYAGYATTRLNPEPYAYETAFAVRDLIRSQPTDGPVLLWGPYLWTDGEKGRALDGLKWSKDDCGPDGTHPSPAGREKVAQLLLGFFTTNAHAAPWFTQH
jgi:hypothetical protein